MNKESFVNAYEHEETVIGINEYSWLTIGEVEEMVKSKFLPRYSIINVKVISTNNNINEDVDEFIKFIKKHVSCALIQKIGIKCASISIVYNTTVLTTKITKLITKHKCNYRIYF